MNESPFNQSETPSSPPDELFSSEEREALIAHRKRYLAATFVNTGFPIDIPSISAQARGAAGRYGTSVAREETTTFTYQDEAGNMASMSSTQCCQTCHGQGCDVDHGRTRWTQILNPNTGNTQDVKVNEDTGTDVSWISPKLVRQCGLQILPAPSQFFLDFDGKTHQPTGLVNIPITGKLNKSAHVEFYVAPENAPIGLIVGNRFIQTFGHSHTVFEDEPGSALIMLQQRVTETESVSIQLARTRADNKAKELEQKRVEQKQQRSSSHYSSRGQGQSSASSSNAKRNGKRE